ncbi:MAG TPA: peptide-methionine (S)-S-oxide reductase MsrA [Candidatus Binataceae bacterium]|nr:peptide-methionine (S)-S-oxide reductase MsrA [Candidatus Binataceae bacterium]
MSQKTEIAVFGGGCFWCTEAVFELIKGVVSVTPGYAGGSVPNPTYRQVCTGATGHAEVARIEYDPTTVSYRDLLKVFFAMHDPTTLNRQGADVGTEYRSLILYASEDQKREAEELIRSLNDSSASRPIVTEVKALDKFYEAEDYHREYFRKNPAAPYCQFVIDPKVAKMRHTLKEQLK